MSEIGFGYGSEWHLLRYLGYHRRALDQKIQEIMNDVIKIEWLDFNFDPGRIFPDVELTGVGFLKENEPARQQWPNFWPDTGRGNVQNWDAVARLTLTNNDKEWMLVEAKARVGEIKSPPCGAKAKKSIGKIDQALRLTKEACGVDPGQDWKKRYYQHANRLAVLYFLDANKVEARLLNIYFVLGNSKQHPRAKNCPKTWAAWKPALDMRQRVMGLTNNSALEKRVYSLPLPVCCECVGDGGARA